MRASLIVAAAGNSRRMGAGVNKQFLVLNGKPVLAHTLLTFAALPEITEIIVVTREADIPAVQKLIADHGITKPVQIVSGGETRQASVCRGLKLAREERVLIHDGARPFVSAELIRRVLAALETQEGVIPAIPVKDTIKRVLPDGRVAETLPRELLMAVQTPQGFARSILLAAHQRLAEDGVSVTDDAAALEYIGSSVWTVAGEESNRKLTTPEDIAAVSGA